MTTATMLELSDGSVALIDNEDVCRVSSYAWRLPESHGIRFAVGSHCPAGEPCEVVFLHRLIANAEPGDIVLHRNRDTLDNRRENLVVFGRRMLPCAAPAETSEIAAD
jgi:hypothetical protein